MSMFHLLRPWPRKPFAVLDKTVLWSGGSECHGTLILSPPSEMPVLKFTISLPSGLRYLLAKQPTQIVCSEAHMNHSLCVVKVHLNLQKAADPMSFLFNQS